jgi:hypothetical protein
VWRLREDFDYDYRIGKFTGADQGVYVDHRSGGRGAIKINLVDGLGNPFLGTVSFTASFGSFAFGSFDTNTGEFFVDAAEAFPYHLDVTAPAGYTVSNPSFDVLVTCDKTTEITVVIAPLVQTPPTITVQLSPGSIWPPNHKMVNVTATVAASSPSGHATTVTLVGVTSNEPDNGLGDGDTANDIQGVSIGSDDRAFQVRAERSGGGSGRVYTATYRATDTVTGASTTASATVVVPLNEGK